MSAQESVRVANVGGNSPIEIHLKKNIEVSSEVVEEINQLPTTEPWVVLRYNTKSGKWQNAQTFDDFISADEHFINLTKQNSSIEVGRLRIGRGRSITD